MNITYFLGAGASARCLPVIDEMPERLYALQANIANNKYSSYDDYQRDVIEPLEPKAKELIEDINWLIKEIKPHKTVDTLAKKFYLISNRHQDLMKLKRLLIIYFLYEQGLKGGEIRKGITKETPDRRYDSFIASITNPSINNTTLPGNFKIITWNYDLQFELALREYRPGLKINDIQKEIQAIPSQYYLRNKVDVDFSKFVLVRLNGVAGIGKFKQDENSNLFGSFFDTKYHSLLSQIVQYYSVLNMPKTQAEENDDLVFNYSWENADEFGNNLYGSINEIKQKAKYIMPETELLVIIGYSFPYFNKHIDKELFESFTKLKKIYIQDYKAD
ncbi:MAG: hypothetical protein WKG06_44710 [Segetibacter sp.]